MGREDINKNDLNRMLWRDKVKSLEYLNNSIDAASDFGEYYLEDSRFLYEILGALKSEYIVLQDQKNDIRFKKEENTCELSVDNEQIKLNITDMKKLMISLITIMEDILPLGSIVDLKKEYFSNETLRNKVENIRMVITHRFLSKEGTNVYFPYAGVVYPTGMLGREEVLYFTPTLIETVVHKGYEDIQEIVYVSQMKREYIIENKMISCGFANKEKVEEFVGDRRS